MKAALARLALVVGALLLGLWAVEKTLDLIDFEYRPMTVEIGEGVQDARYYHSFADTAFVYDPRLIWRPRAGIGIFNRQGLRGRVLDPAEARESLLVVAIGDSNTLGWAGSDGANWPAIAGRVWRRGGLEVEVVNAGVWGYSSFQGVERMREVMTYRPDVVLVSFGANDAHRVTRSDREFAGRPGVLPGLRRRLGGLRLAQLLTRVEHRWVGRGDELEPRVDLEEYRRNLSRIAELGREGGARVVLLTRPFVGSVHHPLWWKNFGPDYNRATAEAAAELGLPLVDVYSYFKGRDEYFADESHFTRAGHELAGRWVATDLMPLMAAREVR